MKLVAEAFSMELHKSCLRLFEITSPPFDSPCNEIGRGGGMEQFRGFGNEKSNSEIVRQGKIEIQILRTSLIMSAGVSSFRISFFFFEQAHHLQVFLTVVVHGACEIAA